MKIMSIYAHPADHFSESGGTLALHTAKGDVITLVTLTHGGRIHPNAYAEKNRVSEEAVHTVTRNDIIRNKRVEMEKAAKIIGVSDLVNLDYDDNYVGVQSDMVHRLAQVIAEKRPDVIITDYPLNAVMPDPHTVASIMVLNALNQVSMYLKNMDGQNEFWVKQVFMTKLPVFPRDVLSLQGIRNDLFIDVSSVIGKKLKALDQFASQGYRGDYARKAIETVDGIFGKTGYVNFAEGFCRLYNETRSSLPLSSHMMENDVLTAHKRYSAINLRGTYPNEE